MSTDTQTDADSNAEVRYGVVGAHPRLVAGALAAVAVAVVFATAGGVVPSGLLPRSETLVAAVPHLNAGIVTVAAVTLVLGVRAVRRGEVTRHRRLMLVTFGLFLGFLALYLYRVSLVGTTTFPGSTVVYRYLYRPVLAVHVVLAVASLPAVFYALVLAATRPVERLPATPHPRVGRVAAVLWFVSFVLGDVVYVLLYVVPW